MPGGTQGGRAFSVKGGRVVEADQPNQQFTCPACGHRTTFDPARCWRGVRPRAGERGRDEKTRFLLVRCANCGRQEEITTGRE